MKTLDQRSNEELHVQYNKQEKLKLENEHNDLALIQIAETQEKIMDILSDRKIIKEMEEDREIDSLS
jgi:hypothetical protein